MTLVAELPLPFDVRYLPLLAIGMGAIIGIPSIALLGRWTGWRRLAERYPDRNTGRGTSFRSGPVVRRIAEASLGRLEINTQGGLP